MSIDAAIDSGANRSFVFTRCAALYSTVRQRGGESRLGPTSVEYMENKATLFFVFAYDFASEEMSISRSDAEEVILEDYDRMTRLYHLRMDENYARTGAAYARDHVMASDMRFCNSLAERTTL